MFTDWRQLPTISDAFQAGGWIWRGIGVWDKTEAARPMKGRFRNQCEYIVWGSRGPMENSGTCLPGVWRYPSSIGKNKTHVAEKPIALMRNIVSISRGTVLDPFMGSGTTLCAAKNLQCKAIGIEIDEKYCEIAAKRLAQEVFQFEGATL